MNLGIENDASLRAYEISDFTGEESVVVYIPDGQILLPITESPFYHKGMRGKKYVLISQNIDGVRVNQLWLSWELLKELK
mgnify:CR=1 FL=1